MDEPRRSLAVRNGFLNSNAFTAIAGSCAGAFAGAWAAQRIASTGKEREDLLAEIRNTSAGTVVALSVCNSFFSIKRQRVKELKETFDKQKADYLAAKQTYRSGQWPPNTELPAILFDLQASILPPFAVPLEALRHQLFEKISLSNRRPLMMFVSLNETVQGLDTSITNRNCLVSSYGAARMTTAALLPLYFGLPQGDKHIIDKTYPDLIDAIYRQTDDGIFYSKLLCEDLFVHNTKLVARYRKRFGKSSSIIIDKPDFTTPDKEGLMPKRLRLCRLANSVQTREILRTSPSLVMIGRDVSCWPSAS